MSSLPFYLSVSEVLRAGDRREPVVAVGGIRIHYHQPYEQSHCAVRVAIDTERLSNERDEVRRLCWYVCSTSRGHLLSEPFLNVDSS